MNISFVVYNFMEPGGLNSVVRNVVNDLAKETDFSISILDLNALESLREDWLVAGVKYVPLLTTRHRYPIQLWIDLYPIYSYFKRENIDIAFVEGTDAGFFVPPLQPFLKTRFVFCDHGALCNQLDNHKATMIRFVASKLCRHTVALTEKTRNDYMRMFKLKKERLSVIYNYVECPISDHYNVESKRIITIGRLTSEKGMDLLIEVANIVLKAHSEWHWDVYGNGPMMPVLLEKVKALGMEGQLHFLGNVDNAAQHMSKYAVYVLPSYREGLPLVLIEALRNRLPMVSFDIDTGPRDIIEENKTGFLIKPYEIEEMAQKIEQLMISQEQRSEFSHNCLKQVLRFEKKEIICQWKQLILKVCGEKQL